ncbi:hypothetical protein [Gryllotalpicola koreensis]|uniref:Terminase n=1 Tax=Gryllotalpicola koreensis TaxID=993086 RepID=A0ABP8A6N8_9MICO
MSRWTHAPAPRFATRRDPDFQSEGAAIARVAAMLGKPLMPWQRLVVDVATERDDAGRYRYPKVLVTVPRQSGKTTLMLPLNLHRIIDRPGILALFSAQTGKEAADRMLEMQLLLRNSPLMRAYRDRFELKRGAGKVSITYHGRDADGNELPESRMQMFSTPDNVHGTHPHLVSLDEIWKHSELAGIELAGAITPAQATLDGDSQWWNVSTMGTANSAYMNGLIEDGRAGAPGLAYFEWSLPDGLDAYDPASWDFHPALGNTITIDFLEHEASAGLGLKQPGEWMRAFMNRLTIAEDPVIDPADVEATEAEPAEVPSRRKLTVVYEVAPGSESAWVGAVWRDSTGKACVRTLHAAPGIAWLQPLLTSISSQWMPAQIACDDGGENRHVTADLERAGVEVTTVGYRDYSTSCAGLLSLFRSHELAHDGSRSIVDAAARLVLDTAGTDGIKFSRKRSPGSVAGLIGTAVGIWAHDHQDKPIGAPVIRF